jgi:hypothetical protein
MGWGAHEVLRVPVLACLTTCVPDPIMHAGMAMAAFVSKHNMLWWPFSALGQPCEELPGLPLGKLGLPE